MTDRELALILLGMMSGNVEIVMSALTILGRTMSPVLLAEYALEVHGMLKELQALTAPFANTTEV